MTGEALAAAMPDAAVSALEAATPAPTTSPPPTLDYATPALTDSLFRTGTLIYTSAGIVLLFFWLLWGDFALSMRDRSVQPMVQLFLVSLHASDFAMTLLMTFLPPAIGLVLAPMVSYKSDRLRSRWGRRIPFLIIPTPIAALAMVGIAFSPHIGAVLRGIIGPSRISADSATLIVFGVLWTVFEVAIIISGAVLGGLINDVVPRGRMGRFYGLFRAVSLADGMVFNYLLLKYAESHFTLMFAWIGVVFGVGFVMMCLNVKEGEYPPPASMPHDHRAGGFFAAVRIYFRECFSQPYYLWCFAALTLGQLTFIPFNTFSIRYAKQLNVDLDVYGKLTAYCYLTSMILAYGLGWMVDRFHSLRVGILTMSLYALTTLWGYMYTDSATMFYIAFVAHVVISGTYFTATASLAQALLPRNKFAQFASAGGTGGMLTSISTMIIGPALGFTLDRTNHNYRLTFLAGLALCAATIAVMLVVHERMKQHGGTKNYVAPGDMVA